MCPAPRLGPMHLKWCDTCNVPLMARSPCPVCGSELRRVSYTPPGDVRPALKGDLSRLERAVSESFNRETAERLLSLGPLLLNPAPSEDRLDEVVAGGMVVGALRGIVPCGLEFVPRGEFASIVVGRPARWVIVDDGAVEPILASSNLLGPGVVDAAECVSADGQVTLLDGAGRIIAFGVARRSGSELVRRERGIAVKVHHRAIDWEPPKAGADWEKVKAANTPHVDSLTEKSVAFIRREAESAGLPVLVSYSGGKDSLVTLDLVRKAGVPHEVLFVDTGLEFPEVVRDVDALEASGASVVRASAGDAFWIALPSFGPPGRDFRWCCKTCKLGPVTRVIAERYSAGALSFIGQRRYESEQRAGKGSVWENPWTPGQRAASPVQEWTALEVWLYIFIRDLAYSSLYDEGMERIGCWLCPASSLYEFAEFGSRHPDAGRFAEFVSQYCEERGVPRSEADAHVWRWRAKLAAASTKEPPKTRKSLTLIASDGYAPCTNGLTSEGMLDGAFDMSAMLRLLPALGRVSVGEDGVAKAGRYLIFPTGEVVIYADDSNDLQRRKRLLEETARRAHGCIGCGVCIGRCSAGALSVVDGKAVINPDMCISCAKCLDGPCVVTSFRK